MGTTRGENSNELPKQKNSFTRFQKGARWHFYPPTKSVQNQEKIQ
jgi:hypothetical protein